MSHTMSRYNNIIRELFLRNALSDSVINLPRCRHAFNENHGEKRRLRRFYKKKVFLGSVISRLSPAWVRLTPSHEEEPSSRAASAARSRIRWISLIHWRCSGFMSTDRRHVTVSRSAQAELPSLSKKRTGSSVRAR
jgi:hypothetical protein